MRCLILLLWLQEIHGGLRAGSESAWLIHFVEGQEGRHLELRKLPAMLTDINVSFHGILA